MELEQASQVMMLERAVEEECRPRMQAHLQHRVGAVAGDRTGSSTEMSALWTGHRATTMRSPGLCLLVLDVSARAWHHRCEPCRNLFHPLFARLAGLLRGVRISLIRVSGGAAA